MTKQHTPALLALGLLATLVPSTSAQMLANDWGTGLDGRTLDPVKNAFGWIPFYESPGEKEQAATRARQMAAAAEREKSRQFFAAARRKDQEDSRRLNAPYSVGQHTFGSEAGPMTMDRAQTAHIAQQVLNHDQSVAREFFGYQGDREIQKADWKPGYSNPAFENKLGDNYQTIYTFRDPRGQKQNPGTQLQVTDADLNRFGFVDGQDYSEQRVTDFGRQYGQHLTAMQGIQAPSDWPILSDHLRESSLQQHQRLANDLYEWDERMAGQEPNRQPWPQAVSQHRGTPGSIPLTPDTYAGQVQHLQQAGIEVPRFSPATVPQVAPSPAQAVAPSSAPGAGVGGASQVDAMGDGTQMPM